MPSNAEGNYKALIAGLLGEPFRLSIDQIADLTDAQIHELYLHERDEKGIPINRLSFDDQQIEDSPESQRAILMMTGAMLGIPAEELEATWRAKHG